MIKPIKSEATLTPQPNKPIHQCNIAFDTVAFAGGRGRVEEKFAKVFGRYLAENVIAPLFFDELSAERDKMLIGEMTFDNFFALMASRINDCRVSATRLQNAFREALCDPPKKMRKLVERASLAGHAVFLVGDAVDGEFLNVIRANPTLLNHIKGWSLSCSIKYTSRDPDILDYVSLLRNGDEEIIFVTNEDNPISSATEPGVRIIAFKDAEDLEAKLKEMGIII